MWKDTALICFNILFHNKTLGANTDSFRQDRTGLSDQMLNPQYSVYSPLVDNHINLH
jgi:hypothetical protein